MEPELLQRVNTWLIPTFDSVTQKFIKENLVSNPKEIQESFYKDLEFGTGGMRGIMGVCNNLINKYTLGKNTQGLSYYLYKSFPK
jgi:phosphomannomutase